MKHFFTLTLFWALFAQILSAQCDLKLTVTVSNPAPNIFTNVDYTLTLLNEGPQTATGIVVSAPEDLLTAAYGLVYTANVPSVGTWGIFGQQWEIPSLASNASATLKLTLFAMQTTPPPFFAQVMAASPFDLDSAPGNNTTKTPTEDDEVRIGGPIDLTPCDLDIEFTNIECLPNVGYPLIAFNIVVTSQNPDYEFVKISLGALTNIQIGPVNTELSQPLSGKFAFFPGNPITIYASPINNAACQVSKLMPVIPGCGEQIPSDCLLPYGRFDEIFCKNDGQNYGLVLDLLGEVNFGTSNLGVTDAYTVYKDGLEVAQGVAGVINYIGLDGPGFPANVDNLYRVVRNLDQQCIFETTVSAGNYCQDVEPNYCFQQSVFPWHEWIKRVQIDGIDKSSGKSQISDFSTGAYSIGEQAAFINAGEATPVTITAGFSFVTYDEYVRIWVDIDRNGYFTDAEKLYEGILAAPASGANTSGVLNANITIPTSAIEGVTRMKIVMNRGAYASVCGSVPFGEVEYYSLNILGGAADPNQCNAFTFTVLGTECDDAGTPASPEDDRYYINYRPNWAEYEGNAVYAFLVFPEPNQQVVPYIYTGFSSTGIIGEVSRFGPLPMSAFPKAYLAITPNFNGAPACYPNNQVVNAPAPCSNNLPPTPTANCDASSNFPWEDWVAKVKIGAFEQASGKSTYSDFKSTPITLAKGQTPISVTAGFSYYTYDEYWRIWIDFNHNGLFETPSEVAYEAICTKPINGVPSKTISGQLNIPASALTGMTHARVMMRRGAYGDPCGTIPQGEVEDYTINIAQGLQGGANRTIEAVNTLNLQNELQLYPNPAGEILQVYLPKTSGIADKKGTITFFNQLGIEIFKENFVKSTDAQTEVLDLSSLSNGQYFVKIDLQGERPIHKKLVVSRIY
jgi:hypothetical protein